MCGIAGLVSARPGEFRRPVQAMVTALTHRGPDDEGLEVLGSAAGSGTVLLGARRLAILDRSAAGHQPMREPQTGSWLVYNGETYNFAALRASFGTGVAWRSSGDTEVLLQSYRRDGLEAFARWQGMFAAAVWDAPRQRLVLVRDRLGIKPLYYWQGDGLLLFASEVRALLASGLIPRRVSPDGVSGYLAFGAAQDPLTLIEGIRAVPPGHSAVVEAGRVSLRPYWRWPSAEGQATRAPEAETVEALCARFAETVALHLVSDVPVGVFLSGGVDSTLVAALAQRASRAPLSTWTVSFRAPGADEGPQAAAAARALGTQHHEIAMGAAELQRLLPDALRAMDQPTIDGVNTYAVSRALRAGGLTVALSGLGGDELFGGYSTFRRSLWCQQVPAPLRRAAAAALTAADPRLDRRERWPLLGDWAAVGHPLPALRCVFSPAAAARVTERSSRALPTIPRDLLAASAGYDPTTQVSLLELSSYLPNTLLRDTDMMSMAHGLEIRVPYLDHRFVEWVLQIPGPVKTGKVPKALLRAVLRRVVPSVTPLAVKQGFVVPLAAWLRRAPALRGEVEAVVQDADGWRRLGLAPAGVRQVWREFLAGRRGWAQPWALVVLRRWMETYGR